MAHSSISSAVRKSVEAALARTAPSALTPQPRTLRERLLSEEDAFDSLTDGGIPLGALTEFVGVTGSGRTTMASAYVAAALRAGRVAAWVDVADAFDPESAALNGLDLSRLLWVRCRSTAAEETPVPASFRTTQGSGESNSGQIHPIAGGCGSPHPRSEGRGMPAAISAMMKAHGGLYDKHARRERKQVGTPGAPNRPLTRVTDREEQVPTDRVSRRRNSTPFRPRCANAAPQPYAAAPAWRRTGRQQKSTKPWQPLDRALRSVDLLLQAGGFGIIVLDLGDVAADVALRIPLATWFRFRAGCERSRTSVLLLTQHPCARSSAELVLRLGMAEMNAENGVVTGFSYQAEMERQRFRSNVISIRKPPQSEKPGSWRGKTAWSI